VKIDSSLNILGSLPDWNLVSVFLNNSTGSMKKSGGIHTYTAIKTDKSVMRFEKAILGTLIRFANADVESMMRDVLNHEKVTHNSLLLLFWNASYNNELLHYLNLHLFFPAFYSGRISIKKNEVSACIRDLKETEGDLKKWSDSTIEVTASKYLTLLKKFHLMEGELNKTIIHPYLNDQQFVQFVYWLKAISTKPNLLESEWLGYCFSERSVLLERLLQKKYSRYFHLNFTGDKLTIETIVPYSNLYDVLTKS
jgi:hypothetical protein